MPKYFLEVPHEEDAASCIRALKILLDSGSHFLTNADFGCEDGVHKAWLTIDVDTREEAQMIIPPAYRENSTVVELCKFSHADIENLMRRHKISE